MDKRNPHFGRRDWTAHPDAQGAYSRCDFYSLFSRRQNPRQCIKRSNYSLLEYCHKPRATFILNGRKFPSPVFLARWKHINGDDQGKRCYLVRHNNLHKNKNNSTDRRSSNFLPRWSLCRINRNSNVYLLNTKEFSEPTTLTSANIDQFSFSPNIELVAVSLQDLDKEMPGELQVWNLDSKKMIYSKKLAYSSEQVLSGYSNAHLISR